MIKLNKGAIPIILAKKASTWAAEYTSGLETNTLTSAQRFRYRDPSIKQALRDETHDKCAYCESKISHIHPGETDHILPISRRPDLCVTWENLTYVCSECNRSKSDYYAADEPLVNPYNDQPSDHLSFIGPLVLRKDAKGYRTLRQIHLSRAALVERKQEQLEQLSLLVQQWRETPNGSTKSFLREEILDRGRDGAEFSATIRAYIEFELGWDEAA